MTKVKIVTAVSLAVVVVAAGVGTWSHTTRAGEDRPVPRQAAPNPQINAPNFLGQFSDPKAILALDKQEQDGIAWGEKVHGLQAGIAFRRGDQESYEVGQSVTFVVYLRNVSAKKIDFSHIEPLFDERMPVLQDAEGRRFAVVPRPINAGDVPIVHRTVEAGQQITLGYPWFRIRRSSFRGEVLGPTCYAMPGRFKVGYTGFSLRLDDGKDIRLGTKQVELDIRKREAAVTEGFFAGGFRTTRGFAPRYYFSARYVSIPISVNTQNKDIAEFIIYVTGDEGKSFQQVSRTHAHVKGFQFMAPGDGTYWFIVQQVDKQGHCQPANLIGVKPIVGVCVDTTPPVVTLQALRDRNTVHLTWTAKDANLDEKAVQKLEWSNQKNGPWSPPILSGPLANTGLFEWKLPDKMPSESYVRITARDKAGNDGYAVAYVKLKEDKHSQEHEEARRFIDRVWPTVELERLGGKVAEAEKTFHKCRDAGDLISIRKLLKGTERHADRLAKKLAELRPDLIIDDEKEARQLKKVSEQITKLGEDIHDYLEAHSGDK